MDVHKATISIAVLDHFGKLVSQSIIETSTQAVRDFLTNLRGELHTTFEEGNHAARLYGSPPSWWHCARDVRTPGA